MPLHPCTPTDGKPFATPLAEQWRAMEQLVRDGLVRAIGVSNFRSRDLKALQEILAQAPEEPATSPPSQSQAPESQTDSANDDACAPAARPSGRIPPCVNQVERHMLLQQRNLMETCKQMNTVMEAYSPLVPLTHPQAHTHPMHPAPVMAAATAIGNSHGGKSTAAVLLAWSRQSGCVTVSYMEG